MSMEEGFREGNLVEEEAGKLGRKLCQPIKYGVFICNWRLHLTTVAASPWQAPPLSETSSSKDRVSGRDFTPSQRPSTVGFRRQR